MADPMNPQGQSPGILGTIGNVLGNPLIEGALSAYLGAISQPKHTSMAGRLGVGGLQGLQTFDRARQEEQQLPYERALTQEAQARVPLMQSQAQQQNLQTQSLQRQMQPMPPNVTQALDAYKAGSSDPQEKAYIDLLQRQAQAGLISPADVMNGLQKFDEAKRLREMYQAELTAAQTGLTQNLAGMIPGSGGASFSFGATPGVTATLPSRASAPAGGGAAPSGDPSAWASHEASSADGRKAYQSAADGKWYIQGPDGRWTPVS